MWNSGNQELVQLSRGRQEVDETDFVGRLRVVESPLRIAVEQTADREAETYEGGAGTVTATAWKTIYAVSADP